MFDRYMLQKSGLSKYSAIRAVCSSRSMSAASFCLASTQQKKALVKKEPVEPKSSQSQNIMNYLEKEKKS